MARKQRAGYAQTVRWDGRGSASMPRAAECPKCGRSIWVDQAGRCPECSALLDECVIYRAVAQCPSPPKCNPPERTAIDQSQLQSACKAVGDSWNDLVRARSVIPYPGDGGEGAVGYETPPFYRQWQVNPVRVTFERPISEADLARIKSAGHSINEGHVLRLHAILEAAGVLHVVLDKNEPIERAVLLLRELRNEIAHGRREYRPDRRAHRRLLDEVLDVFYRPPLDAVLEQERAAIEADRDAGVQFFWPLAISGVLHPLHSCVFEYLRRMAEQDGTPT